MVVVLDRNPVKAKKQIDAVFAKTRKKKKINLKKFFGILKTNIDPVKYQRQIRNEWE